VSKDETREKKSIIQKNLKKLIRGQTKNFNLRVKLNLKITLIK
jgi:hypothetical protein